MTLSVLTTICLLWCWRTVGVGWVGAAPGKNATDWHCTYPECSSFSSLNLCPIVVCLGSFCRVLKWSLLSLSFSFFGVRIYQSPYSARGGSPLATHPVCPLFFSRYRGTELSARATCYFQCSPSFWDNVQQFVGLLNLATGVCPSWNSWLGIDSTQTGSILHSPVWYIPKLLGTLKLGIAIFIFASPRIKEIWGQHFFVTSIIWAMMH